jgi:hypothetical protein
MRPVAVRRVHQQMTGEARRNQHDPPRLCAAGGDPRRRPHSHGRPDHQTEHSQARDRVAVTAMVKEVPDRLFDDAGIQQIHIRRVGGDDPGDQERRTRTSGCHARRGAFRHRRADECMCDVVHRTDTNLCVIESFPTGAPMRVGWTGPQLLLIPSLTPVLLVAQRIRGQHVAPDRRHVLPALDLIGDRPGEHLHRSEAALPQQLTGPRVERLEVPVAAAGEEQIGRSDPGR